MGASFGIWPSCREMLADFCNDRDVNEATTSTQAVDVLDRGCTSLCYICYGIPPDSRKIRSKPCPDFPRFSEGFMALSQRPHVHTPFWMSAESLRARAPTTRNFVWGGKSTSLESPRKREILTGANTSVVPRSSVQERARYLLLVCLLL